MAFSVVEWFVLVFVVIGLIKLIFLVFSPKSWFNFAKWLYSSPAILFIVELILAAVLFYYLWTSIGILALMGGVVLGALLTGMSFAIYGKDTITFGKKIMGKGMWKKIWFPCLIWLALIVWTLIVLF